jgi:hypothetical protein
MQRRHGDPVSDLKDLAMSWSLRDGLAVFSANNGHLEGLQDLVITTCVIPVVVRIYNSRENNLSCFCLSLEFWDDPVRTDQSAAVNFTHM